jgi:hypothetical protein
LDFKNNAKGFILKTRFFNPNKKITFATAFREKALGIII